ncbi:hypothetical protein MWU49_07425 [Alcanivorax sp. S6407]|uniref:hypothetical protein n=1 Tax=Alcanivorax sp. S6407 TaxID=2926424 RepID=UPI001FF64A51|nr:hypothetical protein [Alcanivorax sp. S6407]MCK0153527.1 hypothetical protein [Alcanivorax sp. S6407]
MHLKALALGLSSFCLLSPLHAEDSLPPCGSPVDVPAKPDLEAYPDYSDFLLQIMKYKQASQLQSAHQATCPEDYRPQKVASNDPTVILEPETLDSALARTAQITPIDYQTHPTWYERTTSRSFQLPQLAATGLSGEHIRTLLGNAGSDEPLVLPMTIVGMQLDGVNDGGDAQHQESDMVYGTLGARENQAAIAAFTADNLPLITSIYFAGNLTFYYDPNGDMVRIEGIAYGEM